MPITNALNGTILQIATNTVNAVTDCNVNIPTDNTIPQNTEGVEVVTVSITPISATSTLYITASAWGSTSASTTVSMALFVDSTADALAACTVASVAGAANGSIFHTVTSGSTTSRTYKLRCGTNAANTWYVGGNSAGTTLFGGVGFVRITVLEIE